LGDKIERNEMGGACRAYKGEERRIQGFVGQPEGKDHLGDPGIDGRIILRGIFRKWDVVVWTGSIWLRIGTAGTCDCGNEPSGSIKCWKILDQLQTG